MDPTKEAPQGLRHEVLATLRCARDVWGLVPGRRRWALAAAAGVMALTSACCVAIPLLLGRLIDQAQAGPRGALGAAAGAPGPPSSTTW